MTRRALTAVTAGSLGLLGALLGTAMGYFALIAFTLGDLGGYLSHPPTNELLVILIGLPLLGALGGWCFAGREPKVISRAPLE
jgi:putative ABC transport system permease protein